MSFGRRVVSFLLSLVMLAGVFCCASCQKKEDEPTTVKSIEECVGAYNYDASVVAFVYEQIEGEEEGFYGIQYREVLDLDSILRQDDIAVCVYFYNSANTSTLGITAGVEDLAQTLVGRVVVIGIDAFREADLSSAFEVEAYPEFILIKGNVRIATFNGLNYESWDMNDVVSWMSANGYTPDYSMLDY